MQVVKVWYFPRVLINKDPLESDGSTEYDYKQLIKSELYFAKEKSYNDIKRYIIDLNNSGVIALNAWWVDGLEDEGGES